MQRLIDYPSLIGGKVDASVREYVWEDVPWSNAPTTIKCYRGEEAIMKGERKISPMVAERIKQVVALSKIEGGQS